MDKMIWTVGHSTRSMDEFIGILGAAGIEEVADIRSFPGSRRFPQFNRENLEKVLPGQDIRYLLIPQLGGRRKVVPDSRNTSWRHPAFRGYADYMETASFREGIGILIREALARKTAVMCSEALWWRCHRSLVADYLKSTGWKVIHLMDIGHTQEHPYTGAARLIDGKLSYRELL